MRSFNIYSRKIIDNNRESEDEYVRRNKDHVKITAGKEQQAPSEPVGEYKVKRCNRDKKNKKL